MNTEVHSREMFDKHEKPPGALQNEWPCLFNSWLDLAYCARAICHMIERTGSNLPLSEEMSYGRIDFSNSADYLTS
jgi:hypothetical protein